METSLLELLRCHICRAPLADGERPLTCTGCGRTFGVENGIPLMLHEDLPGAREKLGETAGWVEKAKAEGWYEPDDAVDSVLPFVNRELADALRAITPGLQLDLRPGRQSGPGDNPYLDTTRLTRDTGFAPAFDVATAVADYVAWRAGNPR